VSSILALAKAFFRIRKPRYLNMAIEGVETIQVITFHTVGGMTYEC